MRNLLILSILLLAISTASGENGPKWTKPVLYTGGLFAIEFAVLVYGDLAADDPSRENFESAFKSGPEEDQDNWIYNRVLHPLMGSETYLRAREADFGMWGSFKFSMGASFVWEYLIESWTEHPSSEDLIYTTGIGWIIGEFRYQMKKLFKGPNYWFLDPINSLITNIDFIIIPKRGEVVPMLAYNYHF